jgi:hypothetical protein
VPIVALRDPRAIVVSLMHHSMTKPRHFLHSRMKEQPDDKSRLRLLMTGVASHRGEFRRGISHQIDLILGWVEDPAVLTLRFEDLVGSKGGGSDERQFAAISTLARRIGISLTDADIVRIGAEMFGTGKTFRQGQVSSWRNAFDSELSAVFEAEVGDRMTRLGYAS